MRNFWLELKQSASDLKTAKGFSASVILTLALALGAVICMYSVNYIMFVKPLPYQDQDRMVVAQQQLIQNGEVQLTSQTFPALMMWFKQQTHFESAALVGYYEQSLTSDTQQPKIKTTFTTPDYFALTNTQMILGRALDHNEQLNSHHPVAVISYQMWQQYFQGNKDVLSQTVGIDGTSYKIVGVSAQTFFEPKLHGSERATQVWLPWDFNPDTEKQFWGRYYPFHQFIGKLKPQSSKVIANHELSVIIKQGFEEHASHEPYFEGFTIDSRLRSFDEVIMGDSASMAIILFAAAFGLLIITGANVTNLLMARTAKNHHQLAIRCALGAKPKDLFRLIFAQTLCLLLPATLLALSLAAGGIFLLKQFTSEHLPRLSEISLDANLILFSIITMLALTFVLAFIASKTINFSVLQQSLQTGGKGLCGGVSNKIRNILITSQVAVAAIILSANLDLLLQANNKINQSLGFNAQQLYSLRLTTGTSHLNQAQRLEVINTIKRELIQVPEIETISTSSSHPLDSWGSTNVHVDDRNESVDGRFNSVDEYFIPAIALDFIAGRNFTKQEVQDKASLIVISQAFATSLYPKGDAIGNRLTFTSSDDPKPYKVIGIVNDVFDPTEESTRVGYTAYPGYNLHFMVKTATNSPLDKAQLIGLLSNINGQLKIDELIKMTDSHKGKLARDKTIAIFSIIISLLSLTLAGMGLYGILSYNINLHRHELGVRLAIGAKGSHIRRLVISQSAVPITIGLVVGITIALCIIALFGDIVSQFFTFNAVAIVVAFALLIVTSVMACYLPLRGIISARPVQILKG